MNKKRCYVWLIAGLVTVMCGPTAAHAQLMQQGAGLLQPDEPEAPAAALPPMPQEAIDQSEDAIAPPQPQDNAASALPVETLRMPQLPPSTPCTQAALIGVWKLQTVYEVPPGVETAKLAAHPFQYYLFSQDSTYGRSDDTANDMSPDAASKKISNTYRGLYQYIVDPSGIVYFYQQGVAVESMACFIVTDSKPQFYPGQMLLMPPKGEQKGRLVKVYSKSWVQGSAATTPQQQRAQPLRINH